MQGTIKVTKEWVAINSLDASDINGSKLTLGVASGDTLKFYGVEKFAYISLWQGAKPTGETSAGAISLDGDIIIGVSSDTLYLKAREGEENITFELVKGA